ncbi:bifunctional oligoribonuclease/PAP phosphatase NrnA [Patulibacter sp. NPDC049589]|uniref:DHH family phosphoesterase n=1 Tax=Patulibacter sp. NPDC049589 TaxID=3154731 RepID=UPI003425191A
MSTADVARDARRAVLEHLRTDDAFVTVTHEHPDGDAIGSLVAATRMLQAMGKDVVAVVAPGDLPLSREYAGLATVDLVTNVPDDVGERTALFLDCGTLDRMPVGPIRTDSRRILNVDHHHDNTRFGDVDLVDSGASSTVEIIWELMRELAVPIDLDTAKALYVGLVTDTGQFMWENTGERAHRMAADLISLGVDSFAVYRTLYEGAPWAKLALLGRALERTRREEDGQLTFSLLRREDYVSTGAEDTDSEGIIDHLRTVAGTRLAAVAREVLFDHPDDPTGGVIRTKVSLRSSGPGIDVSSIARAGGGGGHPQAAGFTTELGEEALVEFLCNQLREQQ